MVAEVQRANDRAAERLRHARVALRLRSLSAPPRRSVRHSSSLYVRFSSCAGPDAVVVDHVAERQLDQPLAAVPYVVAMTALMPVIGLLLPLPSWRPPEINLNPDSQTDPPSRYAHIGAGCSGRTRRL